MPWFAVIVRATGEIRSICRKVTPNLPSSLEALQLARKPETDKELWDKTARTFVPRPPKVIFDRVDDILNDPSLPPMSAAQRNALTTVMAKILGIARFRAETELPEFGKGGSLNVILP